MTRLCANPTLPSPTASDAVAVVSRVSDQDPTVLRSELGNALDDASRSWSTHPGRDPERPRAEALCAVARLVAPGTPVGHVAEAMLKPLARAPVAGSVEAWLRELPLPIQVEQDGASLTLDAWACVALTAGSWIGGRLVYRHATEEVIVFESEFVRVFPGLGARADSDPLARMREALRQVLRGLRGEGTAVDAGDPDALIQHLAMAAADPATPFFDWVEGEHFQEMLQLELPHEDLKLELEPLRPPRVGRLLDSFGTFELEWRLEIYRGGRLVQVRQHSVGHSVSAAAHLTPREVVMGDVERRRVVWRAWVLRAHADRLDQLMPSDVTWHITEALVHLAIAGPTTAPPPNPLALDVERVAASPLRETREPLDLTPFPEQHVAAAFRLATWRIVFLVGDEELDHDAVILVPDDMAPIPIMISDPSNPATKLTVDGRADLYRGFVEWLAAALRHHGLDGTRPFVSTDRTVHMRPSAWLYPTTRPSNLAWPYFGDWEREGDLVVDKVPYWASGVLGTPRDSEKAIIRDYEVPSWRRFLQDWVDPSAPQGPEEAMQQLAD